MGIVSFAIFFSPGVSKQVSEANFIGPNDHVLAVANINVWSLSY